MLVFTTAEELLSGINTEGLSVGLVPTMGALHQGHLSLIEKACQENDRVVVSIYVNPTQFNNTQDLKEYPVTLNQDLNLLKPYQKQLIVFTPSNQEMYPNGFHKKTYDFGSLTKYMEGAYRPGHYDGVATVVELLFKKILPNKAYFGEKDFQQLQVIRALMKQKNLKIDIVQCPTVREVDGLAMSSRNQLLTPRQRKAAPLIYSALKAIKNSALDTPISQMETYFRRQLAQSDELKIEYFNVAATEDLVPVKTIERDKNYRFFVAVFAGKTRLIDTVELERK